MMWILGVAHTLRLRYIDLIGEMPFEKDIINIKLAKAPLTMECNAKHSTNGDEIDHRTESLVKINTRLLVKAFSNKPNFILSNTTIGISLMQKTHLLPTMFCPKLGGMRDQMSF